MNRRPTIAELEAMLEDRDVKVEILPNGEARVVQSPVDILLFCPNCKAQHIDEARPHICETCGFSEEACLCGHFTAWLNPPHKSHRCNVCNHVWRPADVPTNGVAALRTKGERDGSPIPR